jgi:WW domain-containing oxidoreductase
MRAGGALSSSHRFGGFGGRSTADDVVRGLDLSGRCMVVTGANTGIGFETARALASAGARVVLACRNPDAGRAAVQRIQARHPHADARLARLDLASFASIRAFTDALAEPRVDVLVCNAGLFAARYRETEDGFESTVGVCHLGHFLLTLRLLPKLLAARGRVVMVSSESHRTPRRLDFERLPLPERQYSMVIAYGQAKLCNALFANELQRRYGAQGLTACSVHPGVLVTTEIGRDSALARMAIRLVSPFTKTPSQGAATSVFCAVHPDPGFLAGRYFSNCRPKPSSAEANDPAVAARLWERSERWVGQRAEA